MESSNTKKMIISATVVILLLVGVYFLFIRSTPEKSQFDEFGNPAESQVIGEDLVSLLAEVQKVNLSTALFESEAFVRLTDFSAQLNNEPRGRMNPFQAL